MLNGFPPHTLDPMDGGSYNCCADISSITPCNIMLHCSTMTANPKSYNSGAPGGSVLLVFIVGTLLRLTIFSIVSHVHS